MIGLTTIIIVCVCRCSIKKRKELLKAPPQRHRINTVSGYDLQKSNRIKQFKSRGTTSQQQDGDKDDGSPSNGKSDNAQNGAPRKKQKFPERGGKKKSGSGKKRKEQTSE